MSAVESGAFVIARGPPHVAAPGRGDVDKVTVFDDGASDVLTGSAGRDWFLFQADGDDKDKVSDLGAGEFADELDFIDGVYVG